MQIKSVKLHNIRSYTSQTIEFPKGSVLLSGNIGSGKSTILLAIEFAFFGVRKPFLSGTTLLRKGAREGSVELKLEIDNKEVIIKRNLKKSKNDIKQESGYIIIDGIKTEATAVELKSKVIELLGYPMELLTKHRDIIYRYTVYTPQEEMKTILFENRDARLNTLRKVFGIDKYKRIRENCLIYIKELKDRKKDYSGRIYDLEEKQKQKQEKDQELSELKKKLTALKPDIEKIKQSLKEKEANRDFEAKIKELNELKNSFAISNVELNNKLEQRKTNSEQLNIIKKQIQELEKQLPKEKTQIEKITKKISELEKEIYENEKIMTETNAKINEFTTKKKTSQELQQKITKMDKCPVCEQDVTDEHKKMITKREEENLLILENNYAQHFEKQKELSQSLVKLKDELNKLRKDEKESLVMNAKLKNLRDKIESKESIENLQDKLKKEIGEINVKKLELNKKMQEHKDAEEMYTKTKKEQDVLLADEKKLELEIFGFEKTIEALDKDRSQLDKEIKEKLSIKAKIKIISELQSWLEQYFINLTVVMEKHIMSQLYREFNESFVNWFTTLIDDETITIRLDDEFTPIVEQNGYETELENLSGGEKTSVALAYRLALNKVINDYITNIKTRDIIILDEPTDGFSNDQLDKVREVLEQINISQVIIVSHESKIESFVDNIIRVSKQEHVSVAE